MNNIYTLRTDVVYVEGAVNGAIYDLVAEKVYSINRVACNILNRYILGTSITDDFEYLDQLKKAGLISAGVSRAEIFLPPMKIDPQIEVAWLELTEKCNLKCLHCYEGDKHVIKENSLNTEQWLNVITQLSDLNIKRLIIIGGEPCCFKDLKQILIYAHEKNIDTTLFTNATLIDDKLLEIITALNIKVKISIYGSNEKIHDLVTGVPGSFYKMITNIKKLISNNVDVSSAFIVMKENESDVENTISFIKKLGMNYSRYDVIREMANGNQNLHAVTDYEIFKHVLRTKADFKISKEYFYNNFNINSCWFGKMTISEDGAVHPCEFEREIIYGNVKNERIIDILEKEETKKYWFMDFSKIEECCDCEYRFACKDCRPLAIGMCNDIRKKNPRCCYNVYKGVWEEPVIIQD